MPKAKIGFEIEEADLANAKAFVAQHGGSLNKLVSALFASLGQEEKGFAPSIDPSTRVLLEASTGKISIMEAARQLALPDAGFVFHRLAAAGLPLPRLSAAEVKRQLVQAQDALDGCLIEPPVKGKKRGGSKRQAASA